MDRVDEPHAAGRPTRRCSSPSCRDSHTTTTTRSVSSARSPVDDMGKPRPVQRRRIRARTPATRRAVVHHERRSREVPVGVARDHRKSTTDRCAASGIGGTPAPDTRLPGVAAPREPRPLAATVRRRPASRRPRRTDCACGRRIEDEVPPGERRTVTRHGASTVPGSTVSSSGPCPPDAGRGHLPARRGREGVHRQNGDQPARHNRGTRRPGTVTPISSPGPAAAHSHSMVPGGLDVTSSTTRLTSRTSFVMRFEMRASTS